MLKPAMMIEPDAISDRRALEAFVVANAELETLEALIGQFNIFDALGVVRQELRHSAFLAFLLDPRERHGLGETFVKRFLQMALFETPRETTVISPIDLDVWSFDRLEVTREWHNIDILLTDEAHQFAVIIENKLDSTERSDQLRRYLRIVRETFPGWRVLPLYLTPEGDMPSEASYLPVDYGLVCAAVEAVAASRHATLEPAVHTLLLHYARLLRREVVSDSEIAELCRRIYQKHKRALDLIFEHRPSLQQDLSRLLITLVENEPDLVLDTRSVVRFGHRAWEIDALKTGEGWTKSGRMLLFEFRNRSDQLDLILYIGPGPSETRQRLIEIARRHEPPFETPQKPKDRWTTIFRRAFLRKVDYEDATFEELESRVRQQWNSFLATDLPAIVEAIKAELPALTYGG